MKTGELNMTEEEWQLFRQEWLRDREGLLELVLWTSPRDYFKVLGLVDTIDALCAPDRELH
jgi:hypothetical protein